MIEVKADGLEASFDAIEAEEDGVEALKAELALLRKRVDEYAEQPCALGSVPGGQRCSPTGVEDPGELRGGLLGPADMEDHEVADYGVVWQKLISFKFRQHRAGQGREHSVNENAEEGYGHQQKFVACE